MSAGRNTTSTPAVGTTGILVVFEGIDGAGKTTQALALYELLRGAGIPVVSTKEPTGGSWGAKIRRSAVTGRMPVEEEVQAFLEDRKEHVRDELAPALEAGNVVIVDRYYPSTVAYQGARGMDPGELLRCNSFAPIPDLLFVLDIEPKVGLARVKGRGDTADLFEKEDELSKARRIFNVPSLLSPRVEGVYILDGTQTPTVLAARIAELVFGRLGRPVPKNDLADRHDMMSESDGSPSSAGAALS